MNSQTKGYLDTLISSLQAQGAATQDSYHTKHWLNISDEEKEKILTIDQKCIIDEFLQALSDFNLRTRVSPMKKTYLYVRENKPNVLISLIPLSQLVDNFNSRLSNPVASSTVILTIEDIETETEITEKYPRIEERDLLEYIINFEMLEKHRALFKVMAAHLNKVFNSIADGQIPVEYYNERPIPKDQYQSFCSSSYQNLAMQNYSIGYYNRKDPSNCHLKLHCYINSLISLLVNNVETTFPNIHMGTHWNKGNFMVDPTTQIFYANPYGYSAAFNTMQPYYQGIHIGKLSFTIKVEEVEESEYQKENTNTHQTAEESKKDIDPLQFLLGKDNPFVIRTQQLQQQQGQFYQAQTPTALARDRTQSDDVYKGPRSNISSPILKSPPLLEEIINISPQLAPATNATTPNSLSLNFIFEGQDKAWKSNEKDCKKKFDYKPNELILSAVSNLETGSQRISFKLQEEPFGSKKPAKPQNLKFKCKQSGKISSEPFHPGGNFNNPRGKAKPQHVNEYNQFRTILENYTPELFPPLNSQ